MVSSGSINLGNIKKMNTDDAREYLMELPGVGPKGSGLCFTLQRY